MIWHWPLSLAVSVYERPVSSLDVMATFVAAAGGKVPATGERTKRPGIPLKRGPIYDSVDLVPYFNGEAQGDPHAQLVWRMALRGSAIRVGDWKLLRPNSQLPQLYNLAEDPSELNNLLADQPERATKLLAQFNGWEIELERNPMFMSAATWSRYNRRLYDRPYLLLQPAVDDTTDHWSF